MRSPSPSPRRLRSRPSRHDRLLAVAELVDERSVDDPGHVLVHLAEPRTEVVLGLRSSAVDLHPFDLLAGVTAPPEWWAFGIRARGRAHHLDEPGRVTEGIATTFLVDRGGREASLLRAGETVTPLTGPAVGTIPDLCRRVLGCPTAPPDCSSLHLWTTRWLDAVLAEWGRPERRRAVTSSLGALTALHPAAEGEPIECAAELAARALAHAQRWTWAALRHAGEPLELPDGALPADVCRWMDDGFFARWTLGAYPSVATLAVDLRDLLGEPLGQQLLEAIVAILEQAPPPP